MKSNGNDVGASTPTSHFPTEEDDGGHAMPLSIRTDFSNNNPHQHFPVREDENDDEPLVDTKIIYQSTTRIVCLNFFLPLILLLSFGYYLFLGISQGQSFKLTPHDSVIIDESPNPLFTKYMKVVRIYDTRDPIVELFETDTPPINIENTWSSHPMLYAFEKTPPLNVSSNWTENHNITLRGHDAKVVYVYYLNKGSKIDISYNITSLAPPHVYLVIREELESPNNNLLGIPINGTGELVQEIPKSSKYHLVVYSMRLESVEVELQLNIQGVAYDQSTSFYKCQIDEGECFLRIPFKGANIGLLAFHDPNVGNGDDVDAADLIVSYEPRWPTWLCVFGGVLAIFAVVEFLTRPTTVEGSIPLGNLSRHTSEGRSRFQENAEGYILLDQENV